jgi:hypothetical protein
VDEQDRLNTIILDTVSIFAMAVRPQILNVHFLKIFSLSLSE